MGLKYKVKSCKSTFGMTQFWSQTTFTKELKLVNISSLSTCLNNWVSFFPQIKTLGRKELKMWKVINWKCYCVNVCFYFPSFKSYTFFNPLFYCCSCTVVCNYLFILITLALIYIAHAIIVVPTFPLPLITHELG